MFNIPIGRKGFPYTCSDIMKNFPSIDTDRVDRSALHPIGLLLSTLLTDSALRAPPIKSVRVDCDSQHDKKIKNHFLIMPASLATQQQTVSRLSVIAFMIEK